MKMTTIPRDQGGLSHTPAAESVQDLKPEVSVFRASEVTEEMFGLHLLTVYRPYYKQLCRCRYFHTLHFTVKTKTKLRGL
jgi:hypothetical protein